MTSKILRHLAGAAHRLEPASSRPNGSRYIPTRPNLRLTPFAWAKLLFLRDIGPTEVGGFGISSAADCFLVEDVQLVRQHCSRAAVRFADDAVADFFDEQVDQGRRPEQFARVWVHTHPAECADPSPTDEETFSRAFGRADWSVMLIVARRGQCYARLQFGCGPGGALKVPVCIDYAAAFPAADHTAWRSQYECSVCIDPPPVRSASRPCGRVDSESADSTRAPHDFDGYAATDLWDWSESPGTEAANRDRARHRS